MRVTVGPGTTKVRVTPPPSMKVMVSSGTGEAEALKASARVRRDASVNFMGVMPRRLYCAFVLKTKKRFKKSNLYVAHSSWHDVPLKEMNWIKSMGRALYVQRQHVADAAHVDCCMRP